MALHFASIWHGRCIDLARLQNMVIRFGDGATILKYAQKVPGSDIRKLQRAILRCGTMAQLLAFARIPGADRSIIERHITVADVLSS